MFAKLVFIAAICLTLNQASGIFVAETQQENVSHPLNFPDNFFAPKADIPTCREKLGAVGSSFLNEMKRHGELMGALFDFARRTLPTIGRLYFKDAYGNLAQIFRSLFQAVTGCLGMKYLQHLEPVLNFYRQYNL